MKPELIVMLTYNDMTVKNAIELFDELTEVVKSTRVPVVSAGSIDSYDRIAEVRDTGAWGFTIGTAFFEKKFIPDGSFRDNMMAVSDWLQEHGIGG